MKKIVFGFFWGMFALAVSTASVCALEPPQVGEVMPELKLTKPVDSRELKYLGLSGSGEFTVSQIQAQAMIVQIFSMYCPYCQKDAPNMNRLFNLIENNPDLKGKLLSKSIPSGKDTRSNFRLCRMGILLRTNFWAKFVRLILLLLK